MRTARRPLSLLSLLALIALSLGAAEAWAQSAEADLAAGVKHFQYAEFAKAERVLTRASRATEDARLLAQIHLYLGLSAVADGRRERGEQAFARALSFDPELKLDPQRFKQDLVDAFAAVRSRLKGHLRVTATLSGAQVVLDGKVIGPAPLEMPLPIGAHQIAVRAPDGKLLHARRVVVADGQDIRVDLVVAEGSSQVSTPAPPAPTPPPPPPPPRRHRLWTWVAAGIAVAAGAALIGTGVSAKQDNNRFLDSGRTDLGAADSGEKKMVATNALIGVAGAAAIAAVVLFFVEGRQPRPESNRAQLTPQLGPGVAGLSGRF